jgi:subtilisin family serine protease
MGKRFVLGGGVAAFGLLLGGLVLPSAGAGPVKEQLVGEPDPGQKQVRIPGGEFRPRKVTLAAAVEQEREGWGLGEKGIRVSAAWAATSGKGVKVAILDTGIDATHPELKGRVIASKDFTGSRSGPADVVGHGTHCAGIVGMARNGSGYVGVAPECDILAGKVLGDDGSGDFNWLRAGIEWAIEQKADVISMSLGSGPDSTPPEQFFPALRQSTQKAVSAGIIVLAAAGNDGGPADRVGYPGKYPEVITVAATDINQYVASFSSRGPAVDVAAPGDNIVSSLPNGRYAEWDGTSMATPMAAGVAALYVANARAAGRTPTPADFRKRIETTSFTRSRVPNANSGWGLIQAGGFVTPSETTVLEFGRDDFAPAAWDRLRGQVPALTGLAFEFNGETLLKTTLKK